MVVEFTGEKSNSFDLFSLIPLHIILKKVTCIDCLIYQKYLGVKLFFKTPLFENLTLFGTILRRAQHHHQQHPNTRARSAAAVTAANRQ